MEALPNPLSVLKREADSIRAVLKTIDEKIKELNSQIEEVQLQKSSLQLVVQAIDNEMDRIRIANPIVEQLEFELDPE
jgi:predicted  nucleic acid-binding Zn-ribbon protein